MFLKDRDTKLAISLACKTQIARSEAVLEECILSSIHLRVAMEYQRHETAHRR